MPTFVFIVLMLTITTIGITLTTVIMVISLHPSENTIKNEPHKRKRNTSKPFRALHEDAMLERVREGVGKKEAKTEKCEKREKNIIKYYEKFGYR